MLLSVKKNNLIFSFCCLLLLIIYVNASIKVYSILLPSVFTLACVPLIVLFRLYKIRRVDILFIFIVMIISSLSILFSFTPEYFIEHAKGFVQLSLSVSVAVVFFGFMREREINELEKVFLFVWVIILVGSFLESYSLLGIDTLSDLFRKKFQYFFHSTDNRDLVYLGRLRPSFFASEPSDVSRGYLVFFNAWLLVTKSKYRNYLLVFSLMIMFYLQGSPIVLLSGFFSFFILMYTSEKKSRVRVIGLLMILVIPSLFILEFAFGFSVYDVVLRRFRSLSFTPPYSYTSVNVRIAFPLITVCDVLMHKPLWGVGVTGKELILPFSRLPYSLNNIVGTNGFAIMVMYFGIVGSSLLMTVTGNFLKKNNISEYFFVFVSFIVLSATMGAFVAVQFWIYFFIIVVSLYKYKCEKNDYEES